MKIGIIGCGNIGGGIAKRLEGKQSLLLCDPHVPKSTTVAAIGKEADVIILAVKPQKLSEVAKELKPKKEQLIVSVLAGVTTERLQKELGTKNVIRMMPNLALTVGSGVIALAEDGVDEKRRELIEKLFGGLGTLHWIPESKFDAFTAIAGSGPAFVLVGIEATIDAAIALGFSYQQGLELVLGTLKGTVKLLEETKAHPAVLKTKITTPGGTTIAGLKKLEEHGLRHAIVEAYEAAFKRSRELQ